MPAATAPSWDVWALDPRAAVTRGLGELDLCATVLATLFGAAVPTRRLVCVRQDAGQAEIDQLYLLATQTGCAQRLPLRCPRSLLAGERINEHDVSGFNVAMDDAAPVQVAQRLQALLHQIARLVGLKGTTSIE